jgi:hypothetical protein
MVKVVAFGTIAEIVISTILVFPDGTVKKIPCFFDLIANFRQVYKPERGAVFFNEMFQGNTVKSQVSFPQVKSLLGEIIGLFD